MAEIDRLLKSDPLSPTYRYGKSHLLFLLGKYGQAEDWCRRTLDIESSFLMAQFQLTQLLSFQKRYDEALAAAEDLIAVHGRFALSLGALGAVQAMAGRASEARRTLAELDELASRTYVLAIPRVFIYSGLGDTDAVWHWLEKSFERREPHVALINSIPFLASLRPAPQFQALLRKMKLA